MSLTCKAPRRLPSPRPAAPRHVYHPSFDEPDAVAQYAAEPVADLAHYERTYMPDDATRDHARRMHYAAFRAAAAKSAAVARTWTARYYRLRDSIVLGNRKLVYRAVRRRMAMSNWSDDCVGDCHIVLIQAVVAYNPWFGVRFSTYAYTCLIRALSRLARRQASDWLARALSIESLPDGGLGTAAEPPSPAGSFRLDEFLRADHPLLTDREKAILSRRFRLDDEAATPTLEVVGREMGLSKERVRQVQALALEKLRRVLSAGDRRVA